MKKKSNTKINILLNFSVFFNLFYYFCNFLHRYKKSKANLNSPQRQTHLFSQIIFHHSLLQRRKNINNEDFHIFHPIQFFLNSSQNIFQYAISPKCHLRKSSTRRARICQSQRLLSFAASIEEKLRSGGIIKFSK